MGSNCDMQIQALEPRMLLSAAPVFSATSDQRLSGIAVEKHDPRFGSIQGTVFKDLNGNGLTDGGNEVGLSGFRFGLDLNDNGQLDSADLATRSDAAGRFRFDNLAAGRYSVHVSRVAAFSLPPARSVDVPPNRIASINVPAEPLQH